MAGSTGPVLSHRLVRSDVWTGDPTEPRRWLWEVRSGSRTSAAELVSRLQDSAGVHSVQVDGVDCATTADALDAFARALGFPSYYGHNADAFIECLGDMLLYGPSGGLGSRWGAQPGIEASAVLVVVRHADHFLRDGGEWDREAFERVVGSALDADAVPVGDGDARADFATVLLPGDG